VSVLSCPSSLFLSDPERRLFLAVGSFPILALGHCFFLLTPELFPAKLALSDQGRLQVGLMRVFFGPSSPIPWKKILRFSCVFFDFVPPVPLEDGLPSFFF